MSFLKSRIGAVVAVLSLAALVAVAVTALVGPSQRDAQSAAPLAELTQDVAPPSDAASPSPHDGLPSALLAPNANVTQLPEVAATEVKGVGPKDVQLDASVLALSVDGMDLYLTPAPSGWVCVSMVERFGATVTCNTTARIAEGEGAPAAINYGCRPEKAMRVTCDGAIYYGVVRDGIDTVTVKVQNGTTPTAQVVNNAYIVQATQAQRPDAVAFSGAGGTEFSQAIQGVH